MRNKINKLKAILFLVISALVNTSYSQEAPVDTTKNQVVVESIPTADAEMVKNRLAVLQNEVPLKYNEYVHGFVDFFAYRKPSFTKTMLERKNYYFPIFEQYLKKYNIPDEIKYLSLIESGLNPMAISYAGASGLWQFMPKTGRIDFGLRIDKVIDERHHIIKSTEAACKYMRQLYRIFGDWELVLAAYNTGPGNVKRAIRKAGGGGFWEIYPFLHKQTRSYVPQYVAMIYMMNHANDYNIFPEKDETMPDSSPIMVNNYLNLNTLASLSDFSMSEFKLVNPHILANELPENTKDFVLEIPTSCYSYFDANRQFILDSASKRPIISRKNEIQLEEEDSTQNWAKKKTKKKPEPETEEEVEQKLAANSNDEYEEVAKKKPTIKLHTIKKGENLSQIANKYGVDLYDLKAWNKIKRTNDIKSGRKLKLYLENAPIKAEYFAKKAPKIEEIKGKKNSQTKKEQTENQIHTVKKGESLFQISQKYDTDVATLIDLNKLDQSGKIKFGQKLKIASKNNNSIVKNNNKDRIENNVKAEKQKFHVVNKGDTIWSIAQRYEGITVEKIRKLNAIKNDNLKPGQKLRLS